MTSVGAAPPLAQTLSWAGAALAGVILLAAVIGRWRSGGRTNVSKIFWRCNCSLVATSLLLLVIYNVLFNVWLLKKSVCVQPVPTPHITSAARHSSARVPPIDITVPTQIEQTTKRCGVTASEYREDPISKIDLRLGRWDTTRTYKIYDAAAVGEYYAELSTRRRVCLATQSSIERLQGIVNTAQHWSGPISLAIFAAGEEFNLARAFIAYLSDCHPRIYDRLIIHILIPGHLKTVLEPIPADIEALITKCVNPITLVTNFVSSRNRDIARWRIKNYFPQNHLRNLARKHCQSGYVFLTDIDIIPSDGMAESLDIFLETAKEHCKLCAYVIPTYELDEHVQFPSNKSELVRLSKKGLALPFHRKVFIFNQFASNFSRWEVGGGLESNLTHISHNVTNFEMLYEPFYVAPDTVPPHDERFLGYGFTRNTQVYEMFLIGYQFQVLSPIFTIHWGIQHRRGRPFWREKQNDRNRMVFETFKRELFARYQKDPLKIMRKVPPHRAVIMKV